ncbi:hypothetical protein ABEB36_009471 [Hypothenemus hampei]|uniref:Uncharacterized protein n=1 Tax=Hypothenemus hampei TaxID=57062 RepID=A0ABD1EGG4_HYPHA
MKILISFVACVVLVVADDAVSTKQKRGIFEPYGPAIIPAAPLYAKSYATPIYHTAPVVSKVFEPPPLPLIRGYDPLITGPLIARGWGPHIWGSKSILPAPIIKTAPIISAPLYTKPLLAPAPIISYGPKWYGGW